MSARKDFSLTVPDDVLDAIADRVVERLEHRLGQADADSSPWMTRPEAVRYSRLPEGTFAQYVRSGRIRARGGKRQLFHKEMLDADLGLAGELRRAA